MRVEFISNASFVVTLTDGRTILTDPWFTEGAYCGSWYNFPPLSPKDKVKYLGLQPDWVYVSHIHPDHLDPDTLCHYAPHAKIIIGKLPHNHLLWSIKALGFDNVVELELGTPTDVDGVKMTIFGPFGGTTEGYIDAVNYAMDTSLFVEDSDGIRLLDVNDNPFKVSNALQFLKTHGRSHIAILPYSGASLYPHAFRNYSDQEKEERKKQLTERMLNKLVEVTGVLRPPLVIPAAGSYVMGGKIAGYSRYLHQATPEQLIARWKDADIDDCRLCLMATGDVLDSNGTIERNPNAPQRDFTEKSRLEYALTLRDKPLPHEQLQIPGGFKLPWKRLLGKARRNLWLAQQRLNLFPECDVELHIEASPGLKGGNEPPPQFCFALDKADPYPEGTYSRREGRRFIAFHIDGGLLLMSMLGGAIWNHIEIGALVEVERQPDVFEPSIHGLMSFFVL